MRCTGRCAFSIVEVLISIAVIAILAAVTIPAIRAARIASSQAASLSNLRGIGQTMGLYLATYDNTYPWGLAGWVFPPSTGHPILTGSNEPFWLDHGWPTLFHDVAPWREHLASWLSPGYEEERLARVLRGFDDDPANSSSAYVPSYQYANSFVASPRLWSGAPAPRPDRSLLVAQKGSGVAQPSAKVLMLDAERLYLTERSEDDARPVLMADGSASLRLDRNAAAPVAHAFPDWQTAGPRRYHDTPGGVRGADFD